VTTAWLATAQAEADAPASLAGLVDGDAGGDDEWQGSKGEGRPRAGAQTMAKQLLE
jgi:hypothetical protein